ncbi:hypothetical protein BDV95DRAFT_636414 [Massariosphaeria phaeospora]|uniref:BTB domain-containing protein n=1 Tax=Massariosphaeria phaeospora TaxID=100035 RepID=A0A7C8I5P1_9PLEO|nr:hypothetical protein BDV95DRAFT_636414 [Massariosphaeria phaeospora]
MADGRINVTIGQGQRAFAVSHRAQVNCAFLANLEDGSHLPDTQPRAFEGILQYLDGDHCFTSIIQSSEKMLNFVKTWHLASQLGLPELQNHLVDRIRNNYATRLERQKMEIPKQEVFDFVREDLASRDKKLLTTLVTCYYMGLAPYQSQYTTKSLRTGTREMIESAAAERGATGLDLLQSRSQMFKVPVGAGADREPQVKVETRQPPVAAMPQSVPQPMHPEHANAQPNRRGRDIGTPQAKDPESRRESSKTHGQGFAQAGDHRASKAREHGSQKPSRSSKPPQATKRVPSQRQTPIPTAADVSPAAAARATESMRSEDLRNMARSAHSSSGSSVYTLCPSHQPNSTSFRPVPPPSSTGTFYSIPQEGEARIVPQPVGQNHQATRASQRLQEFARQSHDDTSTGRMTPHDQPPSRRAPSHVSGITDRSISPPRPSRPRGAPPGFKRLEG